MREKHIAVAGFAELFEAEIARGRLESEGIRAFTSPGQAATMFSGNSNIGGRIELFVPADDLARAMQILAECGGADHLTDEVRPEGDGDPVWVCPLCGEPVRAVLPVCPACHTPRGQAPAVDPRDDGDDEPEEGIQAYPTAGTRRAGELAEEGVMQAGDVPPESPPLPPEAATETDFELPPLATMVGDAMARRAFHGALFGPLTAGLLTLYSLWLLVRLGFYRGDLSAQGMRYLYLAVFLNGIYALIGVLLCGGLR
jgi:hypothetical protein